MSDGNGHVPPMNPYGGVGGGGITMPPYYKPTDSVGSGSTYYPTSEELGKDEMRITFVGSCPFPPRRNQAATCIMVELGNGKRFFFDFGPGCLRNILAMQVPLQMVNDIFLTHLHSTEPVAHAQGCSDPGCGHAEHAGHDHRFESWSFETDRPLSIDALRKVAAKLPANVYRAKGVFAAAEAPGRRGVLQVVGKRVDVALDGEWGRRAPSTRIVAIGAAGTIGPGGLEEHFAACLAEGEGATERGVPC